MESSAPPSGVCGVLVGDEVVVPGRGGVHLHGLRVLSGSLSPGGPGRATHRPLRQVRPGPGPGPCRSSSPQIQDESVVVQRKASEHSCDSGERPESTRRLFHFFISFIYDFFYIFVREKLNISLKSTKIE